MWKLIEQMRATGMTLSSVTCSILLKLLTRNSHSADVTRTMDLIEQMDEPMDEVLFSSVIEACIRIGQLDLLSKKIRKYASQGGLVALTAPTYGSMIKAYGQARDVERIWELWMEMRGREVKPTAITLGCMIDALVMNNCVEDAWDLVNQAYEDEAQRVSVNTVIYSTILKGFALSKQPEKLMTVYAEMRERGVACNTISYNIMLDACAKCGAMHRVPELLEDMKAARPRVEPDVDTYSTIVKGYCNSGDVDKAFQVLQEMKRDGKHAPDENIQTPASPGQNDPGKADDEYADLLVARTWQGLHSTARTVETSDPPESKDAEKTLPDEEGWHVLAIAHSDTVRTPSRPRDEKAIALQEKIQEEEADREEQEEDVWHHWRIAHSDGAERAIAERKVDKGEQDKEVKGAPSTAYSKEAEKAKAEESEPVSRRAAVRRKQTANRRLGRQAKFV